MRIVLDTNVLVSALIRPAGPPAAVLNAILDKSLLLLVDNRIMFEYEDVLERPKLAFDPDDVRSLLEFFSHEAEYVTAKPVATALPDPDDLPFYEVAVAGNTDCFVTGNTEHYPTDSLIRNPRQFLDGYLSDR